MSLRADAWVYQGMWVACCPTGCGNVEGFGVVNRATGHVGGLTGSSFRCANCEWLGPANWPTNVDDINWLLSQRLKPFRNWTTDQTIHDLLQENLEHGILPIGQDEIESGEARTVLRLANDRITAGALEGGYRRSAIGVA